MCFIVQMPPLPVQMRITHTFYSGSGSIYLLNNNKNGKTDQYIQNCSNIHNPIMA